jgi:hypothetical protein
MIADQGQVHTMFQGIIDHGLPAKRGFYFEVDLVARSFTKDCELQVQWVNDMTAWIPIGCLKKSKPIEAAEYVVVNQITDEHIFQHWARDKLQSWNWKMLKNLYQKCTHKNGICLQKSVEESLKLDELSGTIFWHDTIAKEMKNVMPAFNFIDNDKPPIGYLTSNLTLHLGHTCGRWAHN